MLYVNVNGSYQESKNQEMPLPFHSYLKQRSKNTYTEESHPNFWALYLLRLSNPTSMQQNSKSSLHFKG